MTSVLMEKIINKQSRYTFSGSSLDLHWTHQTRVVTTTTTRYKGSKTEVEDYLDSTGEDNTVMRKSDGPYYETDVIEETATSWQTVSEG